MTALTCPVCAGAMRESSRNNVTIDTCTQCRGVWLDRGELEKILSEFRPGFRQEEAPRHQEPPRNYERDDDDDDRRHAGSSDHPYPYKKRSKMQTFMEIFD